MRMTFGRRAALAWRVLIGTAQLTSTARKAWGDRTTDYVTLAITRRHEDAA